MHFDQRESEQSGEMQITKRMNILLLRFIIHLETYKAKHKELHGTQMIREFTKEFL